MRAACLAVGIGLLAATLATASLKADGPADNVPENVRQIPPPGNSGFNRMTSRREYEAARSPAFEITRSLPTLPRALAARGYVSFQTGKFWEGHFSNAGFTHGMTLFEPRWAGLWRESNAEER